ncbi:Protein of unknown function [Bacillus wiedmannii]|uniref:Histidine kinase n=1 Tax=Bacillus wiedmannii TaxID=1890302 RepID=A0AB37YVU9_9BACI|nr:Protein of unknown function [Bacillus wiedmannii]
MYVWGNVFKEFFEKQERNKRAISKS